MTAAETLRELLATRPAAPTHADLARWWRSCVALLPDVLDAAIASPGHPPSPPSTSTDSPAVDGQVSATDGRAVCPRCAPLSVALAAARGPLAIAASYVGEPGLAVGLRLHARDCAKQLAVVDAALRGAASITTAPRAPAAGVLHFKIGGRTVTVPVSAVDADNAITERVTAAFNGEPGPW